MSKTEKKHQRKDLDLSIQHQACDPQKRNMSLMGRHREGPSIHYMAGKMREVKKCKRRREQREYKKKRVLKGKLSLYPRLEAKKSMYLNQNIEIVFNKTTFFERESMFLRHINIIYRFNPATDRGRWGGLSLCWKWIFLPKLHTCKFSYFLWFKKKKNWL